MQKYVIRNLKYISKGMSFARMKNILVFIL